MMSARANSPQTIMTADWMTARRMTSKMCISASKGIAAQVAVVFAEDERDGGLSIQLSLAQELPAIGAAHIQDDWNKRWRLVDDKFASLFVRSGDKQCVC